MISRPPVDSGQAAYGDASGIATPPADRTCLPLRLLFSYR